MQTLTKTLLILLISCLSACTSIKIDDLDQCLTKLDIQIDGEGKPYIGENYGCFCRTYRHGKDYIGPVTEFKKVEISKCDNNVGYNALDYVRLNDFFERVRRSMVRRSSQLKSDARRQNAQSDSQDTSHRSAPHQQDTHRALP